MVAPEPKLRCFVAMAFGGNDTDQLYEQCIVSAITEAGMVPHRVDKIVHNERIDAKIRQLILKADVMIADLTYARPSVYWEAGFGERVIPVVYTCRRDHFNPTEDDKLRNLQVHFDLKNANIIAWSGNGSKAFKDDLRKRLLHVTTGIRRDNEANRRRRMARQEFIHQPVGSRKRAVNQSVNAIMKKAGYKHLGVTLTSKDRSLAELNSFSTFVSGRVELNAFWKRKGTTVFLVICLPCIDRLVKQTTQVYGMAISELGLGTFALRKDLPKTLRGLATQQLRSVRRILVSPVLPTISPQQVHSILPDWHRSLEIPHFWNGHLRSKFQKRGDRSKPIKSSNELLVVGGIASLEDFEESSLASLALLELNSETLMNPETPGRLSPVW